MKNIVFAAVCAAFLVPVPVVAQDGSLEVCASLTARSADVVHHCRRALRRGGLNDDQLFGVQTNLGEALIATRQPDQALDAFNAAIALAPRRVEPVVGRATSYEKLKRMSEAAGDWARAVQLAPRSLDVRLGRGAFFLRTGALNPALMEFNAALQIDGRDSDALFNRGLTLLAANRMKEADADFSWLLREYPNDAGAYYHRGRSRADRDDKAAIRDFAEAARLAPQWSDPWFQSGRAWERLGDVNKANQQFRRAFELGHKDPWLLNRIQQLGG